MMPAISELEIDKMTHLNIHLVSMICPALVVQNTFFWLAKM
jgi:hypothetical protein